MGNRLTMVCVALAGFAAGYLVNGYGVSAQQQPRFAAVASEKGGQDIWGPYLPAQGWPKNLTTLPGHTAAVDTGGAQKLVPRKGANPAMMVGKPIRVAWQN